MWNVAGSGLLISVLEKPNLYNSGATDMKTDVSILEVVHLLRC